MPAISQLTLEQIDIELDAVNEELNKAVYYHNTAAESRLEQRRRQLAQRKSDLLQFNLFLK